MIPGGESRIRIVGYRGYLLHILSGGSVRITERGDADVICTEPSRIDAERVVDSWCAAR